mmetsp:Transcript_10244/g.25081  ORF Transcript_10244/g.25081 Transcript_10244/m.25081 type:complete len:226 (+) Transcript_10244:304-981(+)
MAPSARVLQWRKETESADAPTAVEAWYFLATAYHYGKEGLAQNKKLAVKMFLKAAEGGDMKAQFVIASCVQWGDGVEHDENSAFTWMAKSAAQGYVPAYGALGGYYYSGTGVEPNFALAMMWWEKGADLNEKWSLLSLGTAYMNGTCGCPKNTFIAKIYMKGAAKQGNAEAIELLKVIRACAACGVHNAGSTGRVCRGCRRVNYCSRACQLRHWKTHKPNCGDPE